MWRCYLALSMLLATWCAGQESNPRILYFLASQTSVGQGESFALSWRVENADEVRITPGIGVTTLVGSVTQIAVITTTYTLTARRGLREVSARLTVTVSALPPPPIFTVSPTFLNFYDVAIGGSASQELTIHSSEPTDFELVLRPDRISSDAFGVEGPAVFRGARDAKVRVRFAPRSPGPVRADIDVVTSTSAATVRLIGGGVSSGPRITWSGNAASFLPGLAPNCWGTIKGSGLATTTREWSREDFRGDQLPLELSGTAVIINGKRSPLAYISPTQINFLVPAAVGGSNDTNRALVEATVETPFGRSNPSVVYMDDRAPAFFLWKSDAHYPASTTPQGQFIGPPGLLGDGVSTRAASPGDVLVLYTTGLGGTTPAYPDGALIRTPAELTTLPYITLFKDSVSANVHIWHALLTGPGLYQLAITVPEIADGEYFINMAVNDKRLDQDVRILVRRKE